MLEFFKDAHSIEFSTKEKKDLIMDIVSYEQRIHEELLTFSIEKLEYLISANLANLDLDLTSLQRSATESFILRLSKARDILLTS